MKDPMVLLQEGRPPQPLPAEGYKCPAVLTWIHFILNVSFLACMVPILPYIYIYIKVKVSRYTPWRRMGGEEV
jgi:hypothetical protein